MPINHVCLLCPEGILTASSRIDLYVNNASQIDIRQLCCGGVEPTSEMIIVLLGIDAHKPRGRYVPGRDCDLLLSSKG